MKIICDTNIWYNLASGAIHDGDIADLELVPTYLSIRELIYTENFVQKGDLVRQALTAMFRYEHNLLIDPPLLYLSRQKNYKPDEVVSGNMVHLIKVAKLIIQGSAVDAQYAPQVLKFIKADREPVKEETKALNNAIIKREPNIGNRFFEAETLILKMINGFTKGTIIDLYDFDFKNFDLLVKLTEYFFFKVLETTPTSMKVNDWNDLGILAYVSPSNLYWTKDREWLKHIEKAGLGHYLFERRDGSFHSSYRSTK